MNSNPGFIEVIHRSQDLSSHNFFLAYELQMQQNDAQSEQYPKGHVTA